MRPGKARGFTYLGALFMVAILTGGLALLGEAWETAAKREREAELLFAGHQYRGAISRFYDATPGPMKRYPRALEDLLKDPRQPGTQRYLRQLYADPAGAGPWGLIAAPDGGIGGVYSRSEERPLKGSGFRLRDAGFEGAKKYSDWLFLHAPAPAQSER